MTNESSVATQMTNGTPLTQSDLSSSGHAKESQTSSSSSDKPLPSSDAAVTPSGLAGPTPSGLLGALGLNVDIESNRGFAKNSCQEAQSGVCQHHGGH